MFRNGYLTLLAVICCVCVQLVSQPALADQPMTLWRFLGIPQSLQYLRLQTVNRQGHFPGLEPRPPLRAIADPAHLGGGSPGSTSPVASPVAFGRQTRATFASMQEDNGLPTAIQVAAQIKQQEDLAPQKIKALRYLATIGCGCYPGVAESFLESMDPEHECTEEVRYVAVQAVMAASGNQCDHCTDTCCTKELLEKMAQLAFQRDDRGCWLEPSDRVRAALQEALLRCCPPGLPLIEMEEVDEIEDYDPIRDDPFADELQRGNLGEEQEPAPLRPGTPMPYDASASHRARLHVADTVGAGVHPASFPLSLPPERSRVVLSIAEGHIQRVDSPNQIALVGCPSHGRALVGTTATVRRQFLSGVATIGTLQVIEAETGEFAARPLAMQRSLKVGDEVVFFMRSR